MSMTINNNSVQRTNTFTPEQAVKSYKAEIAFGDKLTKVPLKVTGLVAAISTVVRVASYLAGWESKPLLSVATDIAASVCNDTFVTSLFSSLIITSTLSVGYRRTAINSTNLAEALLKVENTMNKLLESKKNEAVKAS